MFISRDKRKGIFSVAFALTIFACIAPVPSGNMAHADTLPQAPSDQTPSNQTQHNSHWAIHDKASSAIVDHRPMTAILDAISVQNGRRTTVAYSVLKGQALSYVNSYIRYLEAIEVSKLNRNEQLAYWLNLHNIGVIKLLAEEKRGPQRVKKYRGIPGMPGKQWAKPMFRVEGIELSLEQIEQDILFSVWNDPLIIYGLCYGTKGSPSVGTAAFTGQTVKAQLEENARNFINSTKNIKISKKGAQISSLYTWNKASLFGDDDQAILSHIKAYAKPRLEKKMASTDTIYRNRFDWKSNAFIPRVQAPAGGYGGTTGGGGGHGGGS
jgi:hypothetical protein